MSTDYGSIIGYGASLKQDAQGWIEFLQPLIPDIDEALVSDLLNGYAQDHPALLAVYPGLVFTSAGDQIIGQTFPVVLAKSGYMNTAHHSSAKGPIAQPEPSQEEIDQLQAVVSAGLTEEDLDWQSYEYIG